MKRYLVLFDDGKGLAPYLWKPENDELHLYTGSAIDLLINKQEQTLCKLQNGATVYVAIVKILPSNMVAFDLTKHVKLLTASAFWALKVFTLKCKFTAIAQMALEQHGVDQQKNWLKVIGIIEPIVMGEWI